jgi:hypothetical protein
MKIPRQFILESSQKTPVYPVTKKNNNGFDTPLKVYYAFLFEYDGQTTTGRFKSVALQATQLKNVNYY